MTKAQRILEIAATQHEWAKTKAFASFCRLCWAALFVFLWSQYSFLTAAGAFSILAAVAFWIWAWAKREEEISALKVRLSRVESRVY